MDATSSRIERNKAPITYPAGGSHLARFICQVFEQNTAQIAFAKVRQHDDDEFSGIFLALCDAQRGNYGRARGNPDQQALFEGQPARHFDGILARYLKSLINVIGSQNLRHESSPDTLDLVRGWLAAGEHRAFGWLHGDSLKGRFFRLDVFSKLR